MVARRVLISFTLGAWLYPPAMVDAQLHMHLSRLVLAVLIVCEFARQPS